MKSGWWVDFTWPCHGKPPPSNPTKTFTEKELHNLTLQKCPEKLALPHRCRKNLKPRLDRPMLRNLQAKCPYCGEPQRLEIDVSEGLPQEFVSDCTVCCRPIEVTVISGVRGDPVLRLRTEDDTA